MVPHYAEDIDNIFLLFQLRVYNFCCMVIADDIIICIYYIHSRRILAHFLHLQDPYTSLLLVLFCPY